MNLSETLGHRVGPLPVGGWAAAVLGGLGIAYFLRRHQAATVDSSTDPNEPNVTTAGGTPSGMGGAAVSDPSNPGAVTDPTDAETAGTPTTAVPITNNAQWRQQAVKVLIGFGYPGTTAENVVRKYLAGSVLGAGEGIAINKALAELGPTPQAVPAIRIAGAPGAPATPAKPGPAPYTNAQWGHKAVDYLVKVKKHTAIPSQNAISTYLAHKALNPNQVKLVNEAIAGVGSPPTAVGITKTHSPVAHHTAPTHQAHATKKAPAGTRRDTGKG